MQAPNKNVSDPTLLIHWNFVQYYLKVERIIMGRFIFPLSHRRQLRLSVISFGRVAKEITQRLSQLCPSPGMASCIILTLEPKLRSTLQQSPNISDLHCIVTTQQLQVIVHLLRPHLNILCSLPMVGRWVFRFNIKPNLCWWLCRCRCIRPTTSRAFAVPLFLSPSPIFSTIVLCTTKLVVQ